MFYCYQKLQNRTSKETKEAYSAAAFSASSGAASDWYFLKQPSQSEAVSGEAGPKKAALGGQRLSANQRLLRRRMRELLWEETFTVSSGAAFDLANLRYLRCDKCLTCCFSFVSENKRKGAELLIYLDLLNCLLSSP